MSDLISRQAAIDACRHAWAKGLEPSQYIETIPAAQPYVPDMNVGDMQTDLSAYSDKLWKAAYERGKAEGQLEQRWIPCEERLPEQQEKNYWVCLESGGQCQCRWTNDMYGLGATEWSSWGWHIMDKPQYAKVVAWMPLPKPYKEDDNEDK